MKILFPLLITEEPGEPGVYNVQGLAPYDNVITFGESLAEAKANAREALTGVIESLFENGRPLPRPDAAATGTHVHFVAPEPTVIGALALRWAREDAGISQGELANRLNKTQQAIQRLERPGSNATVKSLAEVANALGRELELNI